MKMWKPWLVAGLALMIALVGAWAVLADDPNNETQPSPESQWYGHRGTPGLERRWRPEAGSFMEGWAAELGTTVDKMKAAAESAWNRLIDKAVTDGDLTEDQAAKIKERGAPFSRDRLPFEQGLMAEVITPEEQMAFWADLLGMTPDELQAKLDEGERMGTLIADAGLDRKAVQEALSTFRSEEIAKAVDEGILTQEQADRLSQEPARGVCGPRPGGRMRPGFDF